MKFLYILLLLSLTSCSSNYNWGWYILDPRLESGLTNLEFLISGLGLTISISLISIIISIFIGFFIALPGLSNNKLLILVNRSYIEFFRAVPLLVLLLWVYYGLPVIFGISIGAFMAGIISLSLSDAAFEAEIFRAGLQSIGSGQKDAAKSIGLSKVQETINRLNLEPERVRQYSISMNDYESLPKLIDDFVQELEDFGPNPFKGM